MSDLAQQSRDSFLGKGAGYGGCVHRSEAISGARRARRDLAAAVDELVDAEIEAGIRTPISRGWLVTVALTAIAAVVIAAGGVVAWVRSAQAYTDADFSAAATHTVELLLSPDADNPAQTREILDGATGGFYDDFGRSAQSYTDFVRRNKTVAAASVDGTGVSARDGDDAVVLVAATVRYQRPAGTGESTESTAAADDRRFRLRVAVTAESGRLKVSAVQYLP